MSSLTVENLSFSYARRGRKILKNISFSAYPGEVTTLIGSNGAGKSTLLKALMGLNKANGEIFIAGKNKQSYTSIELSRKISFLTQHNTQVPSLTVFEVVLLGRMNHLGLRVDRVELEKVQSILKTLHLEELSGRPYNELSGGQRRIVDIAQAVVKEPEILILDEPTANLDMQNDLEIMELIVSYTRRKNITTLLTLHDLNMACRFSDKLILLKSKEIYAQGKPKDVINSTTIQEVYGVKTEVKEDENGIPQLRLLESVRQKNYNF